MPYGNFQNPFGLVSRMLLSGKRAAYAALLRAGIELAVTPMDVLLARIRRFPATTESQSAFPLLLIVGPPRAGTTLVYQYLAQTLDVTYSSNLNSLFPRSLLFRNAHSRTPKPELTSYFGQTAGLNEPNDAFHVWNRWLGDDRYRTKMNLTATETREMQQFFAAWTEHAQRPFLNKNNRNCHCLALLAEVLPQAHFVIVNRDPIAIVRSLIRARRMVQGDEACGWGLLSQEDHAAEPLGYVRDVCEQVGNANRLLSEQVERIDSTRLHHTSYEQFCESPMVLAESLNSRIPEVGLRTTSSQVMPRFLKPSSGRPLSDDEERLIAEFFSGSSDDTPHTSVNTVASKVVSSNGGRD